MVRTSRLVALGMAVVFVVGLTACGSSDGDDADVAKDSGTAAAPCEPVEATSRPPRSGPSRSS